MRIIFLKFLILVCVYINFSSTVQAQTTEKSVKSNALCVKVGEPSNEKPAECTQPTAFVPILSDSQGLTTIVEWDDAIVSKLQPGLWGYLNKLTENLTSGSYSTGTWPGTNEGNLYWCTFSIIDSYRLAGIEGLDKSKHAAVVTMRQFWKTAAGYNYIDYESNNQNVSSVQPGFAMFMESVAGTFTGKEHVNMVREISLDSSGNGFLVTNDSNSSSKSRRYTIAGWKILNTIYPVRGFGGI